MASLLKVLEIQCKGHKATLIENKVMLAVVYLDPMYSLVTD